MSHATSPFSEIALAPADPILGITEAFLADANPAKVNLGVGVYLDEAGKVPVLRAVREAQTRWIGKEDTKSYLPIDGVPAYNKQVREMVLGADSPLIAAGRAVTVQGLGGTGALRIGADLLHRFLPDSGVWLSTPSWDNHRPLFERAGLWVGSYPYYNGAEQSIEFAEMTGFLRQLPSHSVVVLHACCHNPAGVDPTPDQWADLAALCRDCELIPFLDFAYQGFGDGLYEDAAAVRAFADVGVPALIATSYSKSFSLYRERVGALTIITADADESKRVLSQVKRVIRTNFSNPPSFGAQLVAMILADSELRAMWEQELTEIRGRIKGMRSLFARTLHDMGVPRDFSFIERQKGMFSFLGLPVESVKRMRSEFGVYAVDSSRVCVAAMNERNMEHICRAIAAVVTEE